MKKALVVGGSNGLGLSLVYCLLDRGYDRVIIADRDYPDINDERIEYVKINLLSTEFEIFDDYQDIDTLIITAGFGRVALFETITDEEIKNNFRVNAESVIRIVKRYYSKLKSVQNFNCVVIGSIAGLVSSPCFSVYSATKAALCKFIESVNIELEKSSTKNRILNVSPGSLKGTRFNGGKNNIELLKELADEIVSKMYNKEELFIPSYEDVYKNVLQRYYENSHDFGLSSYDYKCKSGRLTKSDSNIKIGYLSGTFDLFHIGHLNLVKRAKEYCDYLVVGVHKDASHKGKQTFIPYEERVEIVKSIKYVDNVILSKPEDIDIYNDIKYNYLFVGSDYKGTERFDRYEKFFSDKDVKIIYFPYTTNTSSTQLREKLREDY